MYVCVYKYTNKVRVVAFFCNEVEIKAWLGAKNRGYRKNRHLRTYIVRKAHYHARKRESYYIYIERERERGREREGERTSQPLLHASIPS